MISHIRFTLKGRCSPKVGVREFVLAKIDQLGEPASDLLNRPFFGDSAARVADLIATELGAHTAADAITSNNAYHQELVE